MGLVVHKLKLIHFRNFYDREFEFAPGMTILQGPNAVGKTNTVEALQLLTAGQSFRKPSVAELVYERETQASATAELVGDGRKVEATLQIQNARRRFLWNTKPCRSYDLARNLMSVMFNPDDLSFVKRSASYRRDELDSFGSQISSGYAQLVRTYMRSIEQRNRLLKEEYVDTNLLDAWDASCALGGATLLRHRLSLFTRVAQAASEIYQKISDAEALECSYVSNLGELDPQSSKDVLEKRLADALTAHRAEDMRRQVTTIGPQRDDISFLIAGRDARSFGSQGQQRSVVLAWKMAEVQVATDIRGVTPLLLLDDVMSELDASRREALLQFIEGDMQTVITTTNLGYFSDDILKKAQVIKLEK